MDESRTLKKKTRINQLSFKENKENWDKLN